MGQAHPTSLCLCCGQDFAEPARVRPSTGLRWTGALARCADEGVCPTCYNTYGILHGHEVPWTEREWEAHHRQQIRDAATPDEALALSAALIDAWPDLALEARKRALALEIDAHDDANDDAQTRARIAAQTSPVALARLAASLDRQGRADLAQVARERAVALAKPAPHLDAAPHVPKATSRRKARRQARAARRKARRRSMRKVGTLVVALTALMLLMCAGVWQLRSARVAASSGCPYTSDATATTATAGVLDLGDDVNTRTTQVIFVEPDNTEPAVRPCAWTMYAAHLERGDRAAERGDHRDALRHFTAAAALGLHDADAHLRRGAALTALGRHDAAKVAYVRAHELAPQRPDAIHGLLMSHSRDAPSRGAADVIVDRNNNGVPDDIDNDLDPNDIEEPQWLPPAGVVPAEAPMFRPATRSNDVDMLNRFNVGLPPRR